MKFVNPILIGLALAVSPSLLMAQRSAGEGPHLVFVQQQHKQERKGDQHPKAGEWLRQHRGQPVEQQQKELQRDPGFQKLPPERQQKLQDRLRQFNNMPPQQQERVLNRMEQFDRLTPQQRQEARSLQERMKDVPEDRRRAMRTAMRNLRQMPPDQRQQVMNSNQFKSRFSDDERDTMQRVLALPIGPGAGENQPH